MADTLVFATATSVKGFKMKKNRKFEECVSTYEIFNWIAHLSFIVGYLISFTYSGINLFFNSEGADSESTKKAIIVSCVSLIPFFIFAVLSFVWKRIVIKTYDSSESIDEEIADKVFNKFDRTIFFRAVDAILILILFVMLF